MDDPIAVLERLLDSDKWPTCRSRQHSKLWGLAKDAYDRGTFDGYLSYAHQQDDEWLNAIIDALSLDLSKEFELTSDCLDLYSKDQLQKLAKQAKITELTKEEQAKKGTLIDAILKHAPKGFVPKGFQTAGRER